jgi:hypothetical protein
VVDFSSLQSDNLASISILVIEYDCNKERKMSDCDMRNIGHLDTTDSQLIGYQGMNTPLGTVMVLVDSSIKGAADALFGRMLPSPDNWLGRNGSLMLDCIDSALCRHKRPYKINLPAQPRK